MNSCLHNVARQTWCMRNVIKRAATGCRNLLIQTRCMSSEFDRKFRLEPDYLDVKPDIPEYETIRIRMRAYDYVPLESFAKYAHNLVDRMGVDSQVATSQVYSDVFQQNRWPVPASTTKVQTFKPNSTKLLSEYNIARYERMLELRDVRSTLAPIIVEALQMNLPEGVDFTVKEPDEEEDEFLYVPDIMKMELEAKIIEAQESVDMQ